MHEDPCAREGKSQGNQVFGVCRVARYSADINGSLMAVTNLFPFCPKSHSFPFSAI